MMRLSITDRILRQPTIADHSEVAERLILSIYDYTEVWGSQYSSHGYPVMYWDKKVEGDILEEREVEWWLRGYEEFVYGVILQPPCTEFAGSGARWWEEKDKDPERLRISINLVHIGIHIASICPNLKFWVMENPVGRIETLIPELKPYRKIMFNPCDYGDPYTKKTILWGEFNSNLPKDPVLPLYGSMMHLIPPSDKRQKLRSATPSGFAKAFFTANQ